MSRSDPVSFKPWIGQPPRSEIPDVPGYTLLAHERFDMVRGSLIGMALLPFWAIGFGLVISLLGGPTVDSVRVTLPNLAIGTLLAFIVLPLVHEALHGLAAIVCGARPSYGVGPGFAYTTFREPVGRTAYLVIGLAPLIVVSLVCTVWAARWDAGAGWLLFFAAINAGGAIGDLWMSWRIVQQPRSSLFVDLADGFAVLVASEE